MNRLVILISILSLPLASCLFGSSKKHHPSASSSWRVLSYTRGGGGASTADSLLESTTASSKPSWLQMDRGTLQGYMELAKRRHAEAVKAAEESYYSATSLDGTLDAGTNKEPLPALPPTTTYGIAAPPTWSLPDFQQDFPLDQVIHVTQSPLFTRQECNQVVRDAEEYFQTTNNGTWTTLPSGQYDVAGFWIKSIPAVHQWFNQAVKTKLFPLLEKHFHFCCTDDLVVDNAYLFKYTPETGRRTDVHTDSGCLSFTIALNACDEYDGGGTWFENLSYNNYYNNTIEMNIGQTTVRPGGVRHCGQAVTSGTRYIIGGFCMHRQKVEYVRMLIGLGAERACQGDYSGAEEAYIAALCLNSKFDAAYPNLANVLEQQGKVKQAKQVLQYCHLHVNPKNAEVAYSLGVLYLKDKEYDKSKACMNVCLETDDCDVDALMVMAQACAGQGDTQGEESWYRQMIATPGVSNTKVALAYCNLGVLKEGTPQEIQLYEKGLALDPNQFQLQFSYACALAVQGQSEDAAKHFRTAVELASPDKPEDKIKALQNLYRVAVSIVQSDRSNPPKTREALIERLCTIMGRQNYDLLAASARQK